ncbi:anti-sigma factor family protein [Amycolatopsis suaedae]|uniref:Anti-sigma factor n=1 Tax=Amycolatopsis suaedae TaxID=2510978 RepID=A0A4Q7J994_9PSEU|nr:zf-HC2 domain-containing protein [Amycolatopsis suaedae]RZQ63789.1 anti-sigma factor [Amycolatopsis suaedae]
MTTQHHAHLLGAYVLGALDEREVRAVEEHLATCRQCVAELDELRAIDRALGEVPPEALLDGPPEGGDLMLQRTLREVRAERGGRERRRRVGTGIVAAVVAVVFVGGGVVVGRVTTPPQVVTATPANPAGTKVSSVTDPGTGVRMTATVKPAAGWVRTTIDVAGIPEGQKCRIVVVDTDGGRHEAGSWLVSKKGATEGATLDGSALVPPDKVAAVEVENFDGKRFVSAKL